MYDLARDNGLDLQSQMQCIMKKLAVLLLVCLGLTGSALSQSYDTLRVVTYNLLNYPGDAAARNPEFRLVVQAVNPDLIVVQELTSSSGHSQFLSDVLNYGQPGTYAAAPFNDGYDSDNGMYYKTEKLQFIGPQTVLNTALRDINGYRLRPVGISADSLDIQIFSAHLKASQGFEADRAAEAEILRTHLNSLPDGGFFIGSGDFNVYTSTEQGYQNLIESRADNSGRLYDPINTPGNWHDNASLASVHTQSPRVRSFGGGATGGLDDRFDFLLLSYNFPTPGGWDYVPGSYTAFGNDGNHFDDSINALPNTAVPEIIANALHDATDHLPVFLDLIRTIGGAVAITVISPNGSEIWNAGTTQNILWSSQNVSGTVSVLLNRTYPAGGWETLVGGTANDGTHPWTVTPPITTTARVRIVSDENETVNDESDGNFTIEQSASLVVLDPNGGETWNIGSPGTIRWNGVGFSGNVRIEINRSYPSGSWSVLYGSAINDGIENWNVSGAPTEHARIRISSVSIPSLGDTSNADFVIRYSASPVISHDPHGDGAPGTVTFTALVTDDLPGVTAKLFYRQADGALFDSTTMTVTGYPDEFSAAISLPAGRWLYFLRALDSHTQTAMTDTFAVVTGYTCGVQFAYDDDEAELFNWSETDSFCWAVRFTPPSTPFVLCAAEFAVAAFHPDSSHSPVRVQILDDDGPAGMPGTILREVVRGSVGNMIGGFPTPGAWWATAILHNDAMEPLELSGDFYIAVANPPGSVEAFGLDTSSINAGRSVVFDPCEGEWFAEDGVFENSRNGNRMIRAHGWSGSPLGAVIVRDGDSLRVIWSSNGSPFYKIYKSLDVNFGSPELIATISDSTFIVGAVADETTHLFFRITSSSSP